ncbi:hypothetical protein SBC2_61640 (plasmid) [Caballeronia sp. SBC2]|nr:hypothetical protein SBC2_61640 [Caballeronia sp. SBC2]
MSTACKLSVCGTRKARCSPEPRMCETLLLANPDTNTLRPQRSRASTIHPGTSTTSRIFTASFLDGLTIWFVMHTNSVEGYPRIARSAPWAGSVTGGEACGYPCSEKEGSHTRSSGEHRAFGAPMNGNCTLWTLRVAWFESVFFASFLCRFGQRNDVPPRTVANSDKEKIQLTQTTNTESSNPALTPTATQV